MTAALLASPVLQFADADGNPYAGGTLATYAENTTTPKTTWTDQAATSANTNPIVLDAAGRCIVWGDGLYRLILKDADGNLIWDQDSSTFVSAAMAPVIIAATLADARDAMGVTAAIAVEAADRATADGVITTALNAEIATRAQNVVDLQTAITTEANNRIAADAALQAEIDGLAPTALSVQGGLAAPDSSGHGRITFPSPFPTACAAVTIAMAFAGFGSNTNNVANVDRFGFDVWITQAGSPIPKPGQPFYWMAVGT